MIFYQFSLMQREYMSMPAGNSFLQTQTQSERFPSMSGSEHQYNQYNRAMTANLGSDGEILNCFVKVTSDALALDKISFSDPSKPRGPKLLSFRESLNEFALVKPSDDFLIRERKYLEHRRAKILESLKTEIDKIATVTTEELSSKDLSGKQQFSKGKLGKSLQRHYKKVISGFDLSAEECLSLFIDSQLTWLKEQQENLSNAIFGNKKQRAPSDVQNLLASQNLLQQLGDSRPQVITNATDEKMYLEKKKAEISEFEELVFKINVVIERVNFYTTEIIFPRDQNLEIISFFDPYIAASNNYVGPRTPVPRQSSNIYDFQSCLKVISVTKAQIERLELIEIYLGSVMDNPNNLLSLSSSTLSMDLRDARKNPDYEAIRRKFNALRTDIKEKKAISSESNKALMDLLFKFTGSDRLDPSIQLMLHMEITNIRESFEEEGYKLEQQLYYMPKKPFSQLYRIEGKDKRLFTEINFIDHLVMNDFVMILKLYKEVNPGVFEKDRVIPNSKEKVRHRFYRAFAVINMFDLVVEDLLKCGKPYKLNLVRFYDVQQGQCIEELYPAFCTEYRKEEVSSKNKFQYSQLITTQLKLKMQLTFLTISNPQKLMLRLDQTLVCRPKRYWEKMIRFTSEENQTTEMRDLLANQKQEIDEFNLNLIQSQDVHNQIRVDLRSLHLKEKSHRVQHIMRVQVYLYSSDQKDRSSINIKFLENFYRYPNERQNLEFFYQSNIASLNIGRAEFYNQFYVKLPSKTSLQELEKLKLVYLIQFPSDAMKTTEKITENHIESDPNRFQFKTYYFARQPLYDPVKKQFAGFSENGSSEELKVMECRLSSKQKSFTETFESDQPVVKDLTLTVQVYLISQQYATNSQIRQLIEPSPQTTLSSQQVLMLVQNLSLNDILIYHQRLLDNLIYMFLNAASEQEMQDADIIYLAIVTIFDKFSSNELKVYKPLIKEYQKKWDGVDRENDKKLFKGLEHKVQRIQEELHSQLENRAPYSPQKTQYMSLILAHLPVLLTFIFKLFSREFEIQYAQIRQLINSKFKKWLDRDLCVYRPDIYENNFASKRFSTSRPQVLILYLEEDVKKINRAFAELQEKQAKEQASNESDSEENNFTSDAFSGDQFNFEDRITEYQAKRSTFRDETRGAVEVEIHLKKLDSMVATLKRFNLEFCLKIKNCVLGVSQELHEAPEFDSDANKDENFLDNLFNFKNLVRQPLEVYHSKRTPLKEAFWRSLNDTLLSMVNFVDPGFVRLLFDEQHLLSTIQPALPLLIKSIIPDFESKKEKKTKWAEKQIQILHNRNLDAQAALNRERVGDTGSVSNIKQSSDEDNGIVRFTNEEKNIGETANEYEQKINEAGAAEVMFRQEEETQIDEDILLRVTILSDILSSDAFLLLPNETNAQKQTLKIQVESLHEILAANISKSVFNHIKCFKNTKKENGDTKMVEMTMYFLFQMNEFESKLVGLQNQNLSLVPPQQTNLSVLIADQIPMNQEESNAMADTFNTKDIYEEQEEPLWAELSKNAESAQYLFANNELGERYSTIANNQIIVEVQEEDDENEDVQNLGLKNQQHKSNFPPELKEKLERANKNILLNSQIMNQGRGGNTFLMDSMKQGLGAKQEFNFKEQDLLLLDFENGKEKRLAFFLRETEEVFSRKKELSQLSLPHLKRLQERYLSLFLVQTMQHLQSLNKNSFKLYYEKRPGCLNRLVKEVRQAKTEYSTMFNDHEFFFMVKLLQVIEQFCDNVIDFLCNRENKKYIFELNDKYTYKSIVSQTWLLQLSIWAEEASQLFGFMNKMSLFFRDDPAISKISNMLLNRMRRHSANQQLLWENYEEMGDMILPENSNSIYTGIQDKIKAILKSDLEDPGLNTPIGLYLVDLLQTLAKIYAQIDELHYKCRKSLSSSVQTNFEKFIREMIEIDKKDLNQVTLNEKRKRVCDLFCDLHLNAISSLKLDDPRFKELIQQRSKDFFEIKKLYLDVIKYEKKNENIHSNLLAQLISFYSLMEKLQERNLSVSFQSHIKLKYKSLIQNINDALYKDFLQERDRALQNPDMYICQKNAQLYEDQMREVKAFMHVQDYITYKNAISAGEMATLGNQNLSQSIIIIDQAVRSLVSENKKNQFFDVALSLLSDKRSLLEKTYKFAEISKVLEEQKNMYSDYAQFEKRNIHCQYYRVAFESLMPEELQEKNRMFIYRAPSGYKLEFVQDDIALLVGHKRDANFEWKNVNGKTKNEYCDVKKVSPLTAKETEKYGVPKEIIVLAESPVSTAGLDGDGTKFQEKVLEYYLDNFKRYFYIEEFKAAPSSQKGNNEIANFKDEYNLIIYEVKQTFPTMTMIQTVQRVYEKKVSRVEIQLWDVQQMIREIQSVIREDQAKSAGLTDAKRAENLQTYVHKYITGDDVGGGIPIIIEQFFHKSLADEFIALENVAIKRAYLELFKNLEICYQELYLLVEAYALYSRNPVGTSSALERLEKRSKDLESKRGLFQIQKLQENF